MRTPIAILACLALLCGCTKSPYEPESEPADSWHLVIFSEIVSNNGSIITDEFGDYDDYIEIYNPQDTAVNIGGFGLTDDIEEIKYIFPAACIIQPDTVLLVWCDAEPEEGDYHADFRINADGEWIGFYNFEGDLIDSVTVPTLPEDTSYVRNRVDMNWSLGEPSPGG